MKTAEKIAKRYITGDRFYDHDEHIDVACLCQGGWQEWRDGPGSDIYRWAFPDGSVITIAGAAWDFGFPGCWCWGGIGHTEECSARCGEDSNEL